MACSTEEARKEIGQSAKPTWEDFKVYYDASHRTGTTLDVPGLSYGEWDYSKFVWETDAAAVVEPLFMYKVIMFLQLIGGSFELPTIEGYCSTNRSRFARRVFYEYVCCYGSR